MEAVSTPGLGLMALMAFPLVIGGVFSGSWFPAGILALGLSATPAPLPPAMLMPSVQIIRHL